MPNILVSTSSASEPANGGVGTASEIVVPENTTRVGLTMVNISSETIYLGIGQTSTLKAGIVLTPDGGAWSMDEYSYTKEAITGIAHTKTLIIAFQEFVSRA